MSSQKKHESWESILPARSKMSKFDTKTIKHAMALGKKIANNPATPSKPISLKENFES